MKRIEPSVLERGARLLAESGELPLWWRRVVRSDIGERLWRNLEYRSARRVLPIWTERFPENDIVPNLLMDAESHMTKGKPDLHSMSVTLKGELDDLFELGQKAFPAIYAGFATWAAVRTLIGREPPKGEDELDVEPTDWDACFLASIAASGGARWEPVEVLDEGKRHEFWLWYLDAIVEVVK